jgi:hypothetical protein
LPAFHLDDIGAEITQHHGAVGAGQSLSKFNNADGVENTHDSIFTSGVLQSSHAPTWLFLKKSHTSLYLPGQRGSENA